MLKAKIGAAALAVLTFFWPSPALGCTLWAAAGEAVAGGGSIIAKNRDWRPDHRQELRLITPRQGLRFYGLYAVGGDAPGLKAGVNERGLVAVSASAGSLSPGERAVAEGVGGSMARLLAGCAGVDEALARLELFRKPQFVMLADARKIAWVETAADGRTAVRVRDNGVLYHTNHYLADSLQGANSRIGTSSRLRLERVEALMAGSGRVTMEDFVRISADRAGGPDNSLWRTGGRPAAARTLATWIVALPPRGGAAVYVKLANPGEPERVLRLAGGKLFAGEG